MSFGSFPPLLASLWTHLGRKRRIQFVSLVALGLLASVAEMVSIGTVVPFLGALVKPELVFNHSAVQPFISSLSINQPEQLLIPMTLLFCIAVIATGGIRLLLLYATTHFSFSVGADLSIDVYRRTLYQPYAVHISRNSSEIINGILSKVAMLITSVINPMLTLISTGMILMAIFLALVLIDTVIAVSASLSLGVIYLGIAMYTRRGLRENSECVARESTRLLKALQEGLGGIRDVLLDSTQEVYCAIYQDADRPLRQAHARNTFTCVSPRYIMEMIGIVLIASLALAMAQREGGLATAIPVLGALALGAQRLLPVLQQGYSALATIMGAEASLRDALELLNQPFPSYMQDTSPASISFERDISLTNIDFRYTDKGAYVLQDINLVIPKGSCVGFVGTTGSGKSTLMDIIMSLLTPTEGTLAVDGKSIDPGSIIAWQAHIAHVPQSIFLADCSIEENIAFGIPRDQIDHSHVRLAAQKAQIAETIESLPKQYQTPVGERGVRLSGGQRQRIGIARALYKKANVIIFDEATSALDFKTENAVMEAIDQLGGELTILVVAHRLTTLRNCDFIVTFDSDGMCRIGKYQELNHSHS